MVLVFKGAPQARCSDTTQHHPHHWLS